MSAKERLQNALEKDREERDRRLTEGPRSFPIIGQLDSDGVEEVEYPFLTDVPTVIHIRRFPIRQWFTGPVVQ